MGIINAGDLDRQITIQRATPDEAADGAGSGTWETVAEGLWAQVQDMLPSRGERLADGINVAARPARIRIRYCEGILASMRVLVGGYVKGKGGVRMWQTERTAQIITVPAELGRREGLEFVVEDYSSAGNAA